MFCAFLETKKYERIMGYLKILKIKLGLWHWVRDCGFPNAHSSELVKFF